MSERYICRSTKVGLDLFGFEGTPDANSKRSELIWSLFGLVRGATDAHCDPCAVVVHPSGSCDADAGLAIADALVRCV